MMEELYTIQRNHDCSEFYLIYDNDEIIFSGTFQQVWNQRLYEIQADYKAYHDFIDLVLSIKGKTNEHDI